MWFGFWVTQVFYFYFLFPHPVMFFCLGFSYFSLFLLKHICSLTVNGSSFLGDTFVPSFVGKKEKIPILGQGLWPMSAQQACRGLGMMYVRDVFLASGSGIKECPTIFP